jgi:pyruvate kinase
MHFSDSLLFQAFIADSLTIGYDNLKNSISVKEIKMNRYVKIVCTLGPSSSDEQTIKKLIKAGMNVARLNFSHGTHDSHAQLIKIIRRLSNEMNWPIAILQDLQGPKLRVGDLPAEGIELKPGKIVNLYAIESPAPKVISGEIYLPLDVPNLARAVKPGNRILLDDGHMELQVSAVEGDTVITKVVLGGLLTSHKGVNLPGADLQIPIPTEKDKIDLQFGLKQKVDFVAISFVHSADEIRTVRELIEMYQPGEKAPGIIAKLERPEAIHNLHEIMHEADGVMVARGDLGVETSPSLVPIIQKEIIHMANRHAKVVITATQMLDSMIHSPRPTRAEASDVANAVFDGTDAVMLSGETASGSYPVESVRMMDSIVREAEPHYAEWGQAVDFPKDALQDDAIAMTRAARELAHDRKVAACAVLTQTGRTALLMSKARPRVPIMAFTPNKNVFNLSSMYWGVTPVIIPFVDSLEGVVQSVDSVLQKEHQFKKGDQVIVITGFPLPALHLPNLALLHNIGEKVA